MASAGARDDVDPSRLPPGSLLRAWLPGPVGRADAAYARWEEWTFPIQGTGDQARSWTWDELTALTAEDVTVSTSTVSRSRASSTRDEGVETEADCVTALADGGYTTNVGLQDVTDGPAWIAYE